MRLVIIESPYAGDIALNLRYVRATMEDCIHRGEAPFASHALYAAQLAPSDHATVELTRGYKTKVSLADRERVGRFKWLASGGDEPYAARHHRVSGSQITILLHRFLVDASPGEEVDHINGDRMDNRAENLRVCSHQENSQNTRIPSHNTSGFKGVCRSSNGKRWRAYIVMDGKQSHLGTFDTPEEAARRYDKSAVANFGRFARLNFAVLGVLDDGDPEERHLGIAAGFAWREHAAATIVYTDLGMSSGMIAGVSDSEEKGIPIEYRTIDGWVP